MPIVPISTHSTRADVADQVCFQRPQARRRAAPLSNIFALKPGNGGKLSSRDRNQARHVGVRLRERHARLEPRDRAVAEVAEKDLAPVELNRQQDGRMTVEEAEVLRQHADDFPRAAVEHDRPADDGCIAAELRAPVAVRQDHGSWLSLRVIVLRERAAEQRLHAEDRQHAWVTSSDLISSGSARPVRLAVSVRHSPMSWKLFDSSR